MFLSMDLNTEMKSQVRGVPWIKPRRSVCRLGDAGVVAEALDSVHSISCYSSFSQVVATNVIALLMERACCITHDID